MNEVFIIKNISSSKGFCCFRGRQRESESKENEKQTLGSFHGAQKLWKMKVMVILIEVETIETVPKDLERKVD